MMTVRVTFLTFDFGPQDFKKRESMQRKSVDSVAEEAAFTGR